MISNRFGKWNLVVISLLLLVAYFGIQTSGGSPELFRFFGRLHPAIVHFPIAIMVFALFLLALNKLRWLNISEGVINLTLVIGSWSGVKAIFAGLWLAQTGGYPAETLFLHKVMGFGATSLCAALVYLRTSEIPALKKPLFSGLCWGLMTIWLVVGGDLGGRMTHGEGFVTQYAPGFVVSVLGHPDPMKERFDLSMPGTTTVFDGIISPILVEKCSSCHGAERRNGKLRLDSAEGISTHEGDEPLIVPGKPEESLLTQRLSLPEGHEDQMPPALEAKPISHADVELIKWWVKEGASFETFISDANIPANILTILQAYGLGDIRTGVFALDLPTPDSAHVAALRMNGAVVDVLANGENLLSVSCKVVATCLTTDLDSLAQQVTWLDLRGSDVTDADLARLAAFPHLTRLNLSNTSITGSGLASISGSSFLEYINLYGTGVMDAAMVHIAPIKTLTAIYLWQTAVTPEGVALLKSSLPDAEIDTGEPKN